LEIHFYRVHGVAVILLTDTNGNEIAFAGESVEVVSIDKTLSGVTWVKLWNGQNYPVKESPSAVAGLVEEDLHWRTGG
jgi:hypothetical protein